MNYKLEDTGNFNVYTNGAFETRDECKLYGWICPVCSRVNSPYVEFCPCSPATGSINTAGIRDLSITVELRE